MANLSEAARKHQIEVKKRGNIERYHWLKERGFCVTCGSRYAEPGRCRCAECRDAVNESHYRRYDAWRKGQKDMQERRKAAGLCICCGNPVVPGRRMCEKHLAIRRDYQRCYVIRKKMEKRAELARKGVHTD